jgi:two-component system, cell cycle response regulator
MSGRILIVDDVAASRIVLKVKLASASYDISQAATGNEALALAKTVRPSLIICEAKLPDMSGDDLCRKLRADPILSRIGIIVMSEVIQGDARITLLNAGADDVIPKPVDEITLLALVRSLMRKQISSTQLRSSDTTALQHGLAESVSFFQRPGLIAMVAARPERAIGWKATLAGKVRDRIVVLIKENVLETISAGTPPDVLLIEVDLDQPHSGLRMLSELRSRIETQHSAIIMVYGNQDREAAVLALDMGASDIIEEGFTPEELAIRLRIQLRRKQESDSLRRSVAEDLRFAVFDPLTGLLNRRAGLAALERIASMAKRDQRPFGLLVMDVDRFKLVNDTHGHAAGDVVLAEISARLRDNLRAVDLITRIGGEEFLAALPNTQLVPARLAAERMRHSIESHPITLPNGVKIYVTLSVGLAIGQARPDETKDIAALIEDADRALYTAKSMGRNKVTVSRSVA